MERRFKRTFKMWGNIAKSLIWINWKESLRREKISIQIFSYFKLVFQLLVSVPVTTFQLEKSHISRATMHVCVCVHGFYVKSDKLM